MTEQTYIDQFCEKVDRHLLYDCITFYIKAN